MSRRNKRKQQEVSDNDHDDEDDLQFMGGGGGAFTLSQQDPEPSQSVPVAPPKSKDKLASMNQADRDKKLTDLSRAMLFRALEREPIDRLKVLKAAGFTGPSVSAAVFQEASDRLLHVFGFELTKIPKYMEEWKGIPSKYKDRYFVTNRVSDSQQGAHSKAIHSMHAKSSVERGFILLVNGLIFCKGESRSNSGRKILERDLYRLLHKVDDSIPEEPPAKGTQRAKNRQYRVGTSADPLTPNADSLLEQCVHWDYFLREPATEENCSAALEEGDQMISMGPRSAVEIGRAQIIHFCASILGEEPDPSMLREIQDDVEGADELQMEALENE